MAGASFTELAAGMHCNGTGTLTLTLRGICNVCCALRSPTAVALEFASQS